MQAGLDHPHPIDSRGSDSEAPSVSLRDMLGCLVVFLGLIPWVNFGTNNFDTQPWTLLACFLYLATLPRLKITKTISIIVALIIAGLTIALIVRPSWEPFLVARGIISYMTFAATLVVVCDLTQRYGVPLRIVLIVNLLYLGFAVLDTIVPGFSAQISANRTTANRGVASLAAEPSFLAITLFFLSWIILVARNYRVTLWIGLLLAANVFAIVALARSALGVLLLVTAIATTGTYLMLKLRVSHLITFAIMVMVGVILAQSMLSVLEESRLVSIFRTLQAESVLEFALSDASTNSRVQSALFPLLAAANNFFVPGGFEHYGDQVQELQQQFSGAAIARGGGHIISSWTGAMVYELGGFGVVVLGVIAFAQTRFSVLRLLERGLLLAGCVHAIPINFPPIAILIVLLFRR